MKRYFDTYIRIAGEIITDEAMSLGNVLESFDRLDLPKKGVKLSVEPGLIEIGDGTQHTDEETVVFDGGTHRVDKAEYEYLRSTYDNKLCDVMLYDPTDNTIVALAYGVVLKMSHISTSGESQIINLTGTRKRESLGDKLVALKSLTTLGMGVLSGKVSNAENGAPISDVIISIFANSYPYPFEDGSDKDGNYLIVIPAGTYDVTAHKDGFTFSESISVTVSANGETELNITGTAV